MTNYGWTIRAHWMPEYQGHHLVMMHEDAEGRGVVRKIEMERLARHGVIAPISDQPIPMQEVEDFLRAALDAAWELGLRPTGFKDHTNELTAVRYHLEDMRVLTSPKLERKRG